MYSDLTNRAYSFRDTGNGGKRTILVFARHSHPSQRHWSASFPSAIFPQRHKARSRRSLLHTQLLAARPPSHAGPPQLASSTSCRARPPHRLLRGSGRELPPAAAPSAEGAAGPVAQRPAG